jgi:hypothetical protein
MRAHYRKNGKKAKRVCVICKMHRRGRFYEDLDGVWRWKCWICTDPNITSDTKEKVAGLRPHLWKPGQSGNPKGRPPKLRCFKTLMKDYLDSVATEDPTKTREQVLAEALYEHALKGHKVAMQEILNRCFGSVKQELALESKEPFIIKLQEVIAERTNGKRARSGKKSRKKSPPRKTVK